MRLLRTAAGGFINAGKIVHLADERGGPANGWIALLATVRRSLSPPTTTRRA
jgi:hypothetical protein